MSHPLTIAMPVYNCEATVEESIASILNQTLKDWQLIVYDDGSQDDTLAVARSFHDPRIRVVQGGRNRGLSRCLNGLIVQCDTKFFARMDGDDISYPTRFEQQLDFLIQHPEVDLVGGFMMVFRAKGEGLGVRRGGERHDQICKVPLAGISMAHPTWMGRTSWFRRNPYHPNASRMEDWELLLRTYKGSTFANIPRVVLAYREDTLSIRKIFEARSNICRVIWEHASAANDRRSCFAYIFAQLAKFAVDFLAIETGLKYLLLRHRVPPCTTKELAEWKDVYERTRARVVVELVNPTALQYD